MLAGRSKLDLSRYLSVFRGKRRATINVSEKSIQRFKHRVREITGRSRGISMDRRLSELRSYLRGWIGYYGLAAQLKLFDRFDQWIRRRIRMCYWKRWRHARTRSRNLTRLGVPRRQAIRHAKSRQAYWHMAKTIASGVGMTNAWLEDKDLSASKHSGQNLLLFVEPPSAVPHARRPVDLVDAVCLASLIRHVSRLIASQFSGSHVRRERLGQSRQRR